MDRTLEAQIGLRGEYLVYDGETRRSASAEHLVGGLRKMLSPRVLAGSFGTLAVGCGTFVSSRRWLFAALLITGLLLALMSLARPNSHRGAFSGGGSDVTFDEVKRFPLGSRAADSGFRPGAGENSRITDDESKLLGRSAAVSPAGSVWDDRSNPGESLAVSRRLDAVRSRRARGAWLTGTIEAIAETPEPESTRKILAPQLDVPRQSALQTHGPVLR